MTTELKPFKRTDLLMLRCKQEKKEKEEEWMMKRSASIAYSVYTSILKDITADPKKGTYSCTISDFRTVTIMNANDVALPKIASLFPDFKVEGYYTYQGFGRPHENGDPWFDYEFKVTC